MGVPLYVIQHRVGHGDSRVTRRIYLHVTKKAQNDLINKLNEFPDYFRFSDNSKSSNKLRTLDNTKLKDQKA